MSPEFLTQKQLLQLRVALREISQLADDPIVIDEALIIYYVSRINNDPNLATYSDCVTAAKRKVRASRIPYFGVTPEAPEI